MTGTPDIQAAPAQGAGSVPARAGARTAKGAEGAPSSFEAALARLRPETERKDRGGRDEPVAGRADKTGSTAPQPNRRLPAIGTPDEAAAAGETRRARAVTAVEVDEPGREGSLARAVAEQIAGSIAPAQAGAAAAGSAGEGGDERRQAAPIARAGTALAVRQRDLPDADAEAPVPEYSVRRRETHFGPALSRSAIDPSIDRAERPGAESGQAPGDGRTAPDARPADARLHFENLAGRGAPIAARAGADQVGATAPRGSAQASVRSLADQAKLPVGPDDPSAGLQRAPGPEAAPGGQPGGQPGGGAARATGAPAEAPAASAQLSTISYQVTASGPVRVLQIQLQPVELGVLEVSMRLSDAGLEVHIEASRHEAFALLKSDRDTLANVLRAAGHAVDGVTVTISERGGSQASPAGQDGAAAFGFGERPDARPGSSREQGAQSAGHSPQRPDGSDREQVRDDQSPAARSHLGRGHVYL